MGPARRHLPSLWLLAVGVACLSGAFAIFPRSDIPTRPRPVQVVVMSPLQLTSATLEVRPDEGARSTRDSDKWLVTLALTGYQDPQLANDSAEVTVYFPDQPQLSFSCPDYCSKPDYSSIGAHSSPADQGVMTSFDLHRDSSYRDANYRVGSIDIRVSGTRGLPIFRCTPAECRGVVPRIFGIQMSAWDDQEEYADGSAEVRLQADDLVRYRWDGASLDASSGTLYMSSTLDYTSREPNYAGAQVDGVNTSEARSASDLTFWSGLLVGLAGGALIGAVQLFLTSAPTTKTHRS